MKHFLVSVGILLTAGGVLRAQTDEVNLQKYWKLRNNFRENFIKIGPDFGESLPVRAIRPLQCVDNYTQDGTSYNSTPLGSTSHGELKWGDGMIRHGYYLGLLATEYRLLKNAGQDVTGVLNELFYALNAINRLDYFAETEQGEAYGASFNPSLNGFYQREDIPENFASLHWGTSKIEARCVNSPHYKTNNAAHSNEGGLYGFEAHGNSYQNSPSSDQFSSLMVGFSLVHKLVDPNEFVQPPGSEFGFNIINENKAIVDRMVNYLNAHNWMMIDVNGWPVNNGGGDVFWSAYPISVAAKRITGHDYVADWDRRIASFFLKHVQYCITGYGVDGNTPAGQQGACDTVLNQSIWGGLGVTNPLGVYGQLINQAYWDLQDGVPVGPDNNQDISEFQQWLSEGDLTRPYNFSAGVWQSALSFLEDFLDDKKIAAFPSPLNDIELNSVSFENEGSMDDATVVLITNYGVASGLWSGSNMMAISQLTGNIQAELSNAIIRGEAPPRGKQDYKGYLDGMESTGPYNLIGKSGASYATKAAPNGWASEHRWTWMSAAYGNSNEEIQGIYNGLDYMLFHNLYYLAFANSTPTFEPKDECFCQGMPSYTSNANTADELHANENLINKLAFTPYCTENVFTPINNTISTVFDLRPYFANYSQMGIYTTKFQKEDATITGTGDVNVLTRFKICNTKALTIQAGGRMDIEKAGVWLNNYAQIDNSGDIRIKAGTTLTVGQLGKLILRNGSKLTIEEGATLILEEGAELQYYSGAVIYMNGPGSIIRLGGSIKVMNSAEFTITHLGTSAGKIIVNGTSAGLLTATANVGKFKLVGKGISDPLIILEPNAKLWAMDTYAQSLTIQQCKVVFGAGASLRCDQPFYTGGVEFTSTATNGGVTTTELAVINSSRFINCPIFAKMNIENKGTFGCYNSYLLADSPTLNPNDKALIDIVGRGYDISTCDFHTTKNYAVKSNNMTLASTIAGGSIQYYGTLPVGHQLTGIYDHSTVEVSVKNMIINKCYTGIHKLNGKLTLRCNVISNNQDLNVKADQSTLLNMNSQKLGGYNTLLKTTNNKNIFLAAANIDIMYGYNFIEYTTANTTISGAINSYCTTCPGLNFMQNQWVASGKTPIGFGGIYSLAGTSYPVAVTITPVALLQVCPTSSTPGGGENQRSAVADDGMPLMYSPSAGDSVRLDELIYNASENMSFYGDSTANDLFAVDLLDEVFNADLDSTDELSNYWKWFAFEQMKTAMESAFANNQLNVTDNATGFDPYVTKYVHALGEMTEPVITQENYTTQFYHEINKAHLFRMTGHPNIGLNILTELESCGLDSAEQAGLNYWKTVFEADIIANQIGLAALDSTIVVDTTGYLSPALTVNAFRFGAQINDMNNILYPNCNYFITRDKKMDLNAMNLYPNPATSEVTIKFNHPLMKGEGIVTIQQADGRVVYTKTIDTNDAIGLTVQVSEWKSGAYQVRYQDPEGFVSTAQLIVK